MDSMFSKLEEVERRFEEIESRLADPDLSASRPGEFRKLSQEHATLQEIVQEYQHYRAVKEQIESNQEVLREKDPDLVELAKEELAKLEPELEESQEKLKFLLLPKDPNDEKNVVLEIRAGAGGEEAALFVNNLFRMYQKFAEREGWKMDVLSSHPTDMGGFKEMIVMIEGDRVYSRLKWEGGVHRVQRVPETEAQGRVHTSTATVAVLPEAEEVDVQINQEDLRTDVFRSSGAGGQSVNTTESAVRITHIPTGIIVTCQDERSQHKNRDKAMKVLRARLLDQEQQKADQEQMDARRNMVGSGDRSERIRTYNFPQGRLTDHRIGLTLYNLGEIMEGKIDYVLSSLQQHYQMEALKAQGLSQDQNEKEAK